MSSEVKLLEIILDRHVSFAAHSKKLPNNCIVSRVDYYSVIQRMWSSERKLVTGEGQATPRGSMEIPKLD